MFSTLFTLSTLAILAAATPTARQASSCTTGAVQCCESTTTASDPVAASLLGLLGIVLQDVNIPVGLNCSPISVIGVGGGTWYVTRCKELRVYVYYDEVSDVLCDSSANTVCCEDNSNGEDRTLCSCIRVRDVY